MLQVKNRLINTVMEDKIKDLILNYKDKLISLNNDLIKSSLEQDTEASFKTSIYIIAYNRVVGDLQRCVEPHSNQSTN